MQVGCPAYIARLASPTTRRGVGGKLGMATICHLRHGHAGVVYIRTYRRDWAAIAETVLPRGAAPGAPVLHAPPGPHGAAPG